MKNVKLKLAFNALIVIVAALVAQDANAIQSVTCSISNSLYNKAGLKLTSSSQSYAGYGKDACLRELHNPQNIEVSCRAAGLKSQSGIKIVSVARFAFNGETRYQEIERACLQSPPRPPVFCSARLENGVAFNAPQPVDPADCVRHCDLVYGKNRTAKISCHANADVIKLYNELVPPPQPIYQRVCMYHFALKPSSSPLPTSPVPVEPPFGHKLVDSAGECLKVCDGASKRLNVANGECRFDNQVLKTYDRNYYAIPY